MSNQFMMTVMDSFYSDELGLVVTGEIESGCICAGDTIEVQRHEDSMICRVNLVAYPGLKTIEVADKESGYIGISIEDRKKDEIIRGDLLCSV